MWFIDSYDKRNIQVLLKFFFINSNFGNISKDPLLDNPIMTNIFFACFIPSACLFFFHMLNL